MDWRRGTAVAGVLLLAALAAAGCGLGPGADVGVVELTVTQDYGAEPVAAESVDAKESSTVMRVLEGAADIETRYGGAYVKSIDGIAEAERGASPYDWFYYVDGIEAPVGAADSSVSGGERIWWDYRDWSATDHVAAVVGQWPAPFAAGYEGRAHPVAVECEGGGAEVCGEVEAALEGEGVALASGAPKGAIRVLVGPWAKLRSDPAAAQLERGPAESGIYADFEPAAGGWTLVGLDEGGNPAETFGPGAGLVAATRRYEGPPVWLVTGGAAAGVQAAADLLDAADLRDHYAVESEDGAETPLPLRSP